MSKKLALALLAFALVGCDNTEAALPACVVTNPYASTFIYACSDPTKGRCLDAVGTPMYVGCELDIGTAAAPAVVECVASCD